MAKRKKKASRRRRSGGFLCTGDTKLAKFNPRSGKKFRRPMCVPTHGSGRPVPPRKAPSAAALVKKSPALDCAKGYAMGGANPMTGKKYARPTCVRVLKTGKVKTSRPRRGKKTRASAVKITRVVAVSGRR